MPEKVMPGPIVDTCGIREAVCIHTKKIYDSCRDKDCIEDLRFYPTLASQEIISRALTVKGGSAELIHVYVDVEPVVFHRGFFTVDMRFFYRVTLQAYLSCPRPVEVEGLCVFDKRAILFGSEGSAKIFSSATHSCEPDRQGMEKSNLPVAVVETTAHKPTWGGRLARGNTVFLDILGKGLTIAEEWHTILNTISFREKGSSFRLAATITRSMQIASPAARARATGW